MKKIKVAVVVPIYNVEAYLAECLESIVNQTMQEIEIILVDDCGTDASMEIAERYSRRDSRIKIVKHSHNQGISAARNSGIMNSSAEYILFVDSDDYVRADYCEKLYRTIVDEQADLAMCGVELVGEWHKGWPKLEKYVNGHFGSRETLSEKVIEKTNCCTWNKIYRRSIIEKEMIQFPVGYKHEDEVWWRVYGHYAQTIAYVEEPLYYYRQRADSIMDNERTGQKMYAERIRMAIRYYEEVKQRGLEEKYKSALDYVMQMLETSIKKNQPVYREALCKIVVDFIREKQLCEKDFSLMGNRAWRLLQEGKLASVHKLCGGLITIEEKSSKCIIKCLGVRIWCEKYEKARIRRLLLGFIPLP